MAKRNGLDVSIIDQLTYDANVTVLTILAAHQTLTQSQKDRIMLVPDADLCELCGDWQAARLLRHVTGSLAHDRAQRKGWFAWTREQGVEARFCHLARLHGGYAFKWVSPGVSGVPDRILFLPDGRIYLVELKRPGGHTHGTQPAIHRKLTRLGHPVYVVSDPDRFFRHIVDGEGDGAGESPAS